MPGGGLHYRGGRQTRCVGRAADPAPVAMCGYLNNPTATADMIEPDGWLHTGDLVVQDSEEWFRVADRLKE